MARNIKHYVQVAKVEAEKSEIWLKGFRSGNHKPSMLDFLQSNHRVAEHAAQQAEDIAGETATITDRAYAQTAHLYHLVARANLRRALGVLTDMLRAREQLTSCLNLATNAHIDLKAPRAAQELTAAADLALAVVASLDAEIDAITPWEAVEDEEGEEPAPDTEDAFIASCGPLGSLTKAQLGGKVVGVFKEEEPARAALKAAMDRNNYWPNVWRVDDHGGYTLITL